jgi:RNA polymerase sigma-70 factor (ECF subfamily)
VDGRETVFERHRPALLGLAYRLLGSVWDAEDVVQEAYLRWIGAENVRESRAFLITVVSRLALDQLRSARVTREAYTGPWLPEPVSAERFGPLETAELRDTLSYAVLHMMERLSPPERATFVLRAAFELPYADIAAIVGSPAATCRQLYHRAVKRLEDGRDRYRPSSAEHDRLLNRLLEATTTGDLAGLGDVLAEDVVVHNDGGGRVRAALRPVEGREKVLAFMGGLVERYAFTGGRVVESNGAAAIWVSVDGGEQLVTIEVREGRIGAVYTVLNPDKLDHIRPA